MGLRKISLTNNKNKEKIVEKKTLVEKITIHHDFNYGQILEQVRSVGGWAHLNYILIHCGWLNIVGFGYCNSAQSRNRGPGFNRACELTNVNTSFILFYFSLLGCVHKHFCLHYNLSYGWALIWLLALANMLKFNNWIALIKFGQYNVTL